MPYTPFTFEQHRKFLMDTLRVNMPKADLSPGSFWYLWAQGQARGLAGITSGITHLTRQILPDRATGIDLDHHAQVYDLPRHLPAKAWGLVRATAVKPYPDPGPPDPPVDEVYLVDLNGRAYNIDDYETLKAPMAGTVDFSVTAREPCKVGDQVPEVHLSFVYDNSGGERTPVEDWFMDSKVITLEPGLTGGRDLEIDTSLSSRIVQTLSAGRLGDTVDDYKRWVLERDDGVDMNRRVKIDNKYYEIKEIFVYNDPEIRNRVYLLPLTAPPDRIGPAGFSQAVFNHVTKKAPVTVDLVVPQIYEIPVDVDFFIEPAAHARWDWNGHKRVSDQTASDRKIPLDRATDPVSGVVYDGADGLKAGMRIMIDGAERAIGHVSLGSDTIWLSEDLPFTPDEYTIVYPGGPATLPVQQEFRRLLEIIGPIHKAISPVDAVRGFIFSVFTDAMMELDCVHDVKVVTPYIQAGDVPSAYNSGLFAILPIPNKIVVAPFAARKE
jgi:Baseplate J-like protein